MRVGGAPSLRSTERSSYREGRELRELRFTQTEGSLQPGRLRVVGEPSWHRGAWDSRPPVLADPCPFFSDTSQRATLSGRVQDGPVLAPGRSMSGHVPCGF